MFESVRLEGDFTLSSGRKSNVFYDFDLLKPEEHLAASFKLTNLCEGLSADTIIVPALGGIIPGFLMAGAKNANLTIVTHDNKIKGRKPGFSFLVVDDVITSFGTIDRIVDLVRSECGRVHLVGVASYIFRGSEEDLEEGKKKYKEIRFLERKEIEE